MSQHGEDQQPSLDKMDEDELRHELRRVGWNIGHTARTSYGITATFRKYPDTWTTEEGAPGTRTASGKDYADAIRTFLKQLQEEESE